MSSFVTLFFDILILAALGVTIFYCLRLSRQFNQMQANRKAFETLIQSLNVASSRAEAAIRAFKEFATDGGDTLQEKIGRAQAMSDELEIIIQAGDNLANRLQDQAEKSRRAATGDSAPNRATSDDLAVGTAPRTRAEQELLEALRAKQKSGV